MNLCPVTIFDEDLYDRWDLDIWENECSDTLQNIAARVCLELAPDFAISLVLTPAAARTIRPATCGTRSSRT